MSMRGDGMGRFLQLLLSCLGLLVITGGCQSAENAGAPAVGRAQVISTPFSRSVSEIDSLVATATPAPYEITLRDNEDVAVDISIHREDKTPRGKTLVEAVISARNSGSSSYAGPETGTLEVFGADGRRIAQGVVTQTGATYIDYANPDSSIPGFSHSEVLYKYQMNGVELIGNVSKGESISCRLKFPPNKTLWLLDSAVTWRED